MEKRVRQRKQQKQEFGPHHRAWLAYRGAGDYPVMAFAPDALVHQRAHGMPNAARLAALRRAWQVLGPGILAEFRRDQAAPPPMQLACIKRVDARTKRYLEQIAADALERHFSAPPLGLRLFGEPTGRTTK